MNSASEFNRERVIEEWNSYISNESFYMLGTRSEILQSWERCKLHGVNPFDNSLHDAISKSKFETALLKKERLIRIAQPFMNNLYKFVRGTGFVVVMTDEQGYILEMFADDDVWQNPMTKNFFLGSSWKEEIAGTNAIGTALVIQEPIQVSGAEHYCEKHHCLTCSAAPIFDVTGSLIGVINISGACTSSHLHTLGMVVATADAIMAQLRIDIKNHQLGMANRKLNNFFNMVLDGVLIVNTDGYLTDMNPAAEDMFGIERKDMNDILVQNLIVLRHQSEDHSSFFMKSCSYRESIMQTKNSQSGCIISTAPYYNENNQLMGSFIIVKPVKQVQKLVNQFGGYMASLQFDDIIGESYALREAIRISNLTAINDSNVLLTGESGTGKEIFAQAIHNRSTQSNSPFIPLNCAAIPRELIGSELFGYEEGAFTGAKRGGKPGKFEQASGGTLFLDEIGDMPLEHQTVLLRVIQEKKIVRIGGEKMIPVNVRLICATNKNLYEEVERGTFRRDLYYRLNVMSIMIPPLRSRPEDIALLFDYFLSKLCKNRGITLRVLPLVYEILTDYSWPGNVRELQNVVERAVNLAERNEINLNHLPDIIKNSININQKNLTSLTSCRSINKEEIMKNEKIKIVELLNIHVGNVSRVAKDLGVSRKTVYNKMKLYSIYNEK